MTYKVVKQVWTPDGLECEHPLCERLHKPWHVREGNKWYCDKPAGERTEWIIIDDVSGEQLVDWAGHCCWDLKRDAVKALKNHQEGN